MTSCSGARSPGQKAALPLIKAVCAYVHTCVHVCVSVKVRERPWASCLISSGLWSKLYNEDNNSIFIIWKDYKDSPM